MRSLAVAYLVVVTATCSALPTLMVSAETLEATAAELPHATASAWMPVVEERQAIYRECHELVKKDEFLTQEQWRQRRQAACKRAGEQYLAKVLGRPLPVYRVRKIPVRMWEYDPQRRLLGLESNLRLIASRGYESEVSGFLGSVTKNVRDVITFNLPGGVETIASISPDEARRWKTSGIPLIMAFEFVLFEDVSSMVSAHKKLLRLRLMPVRLAYSLGDEVVYQVTFRTTMSEQCLRVAYARDYNFDEDKIRGLGCGTGPARQDSEGWEKKWVPPFAP